MEIIQIGECKMRIMFFSLSAHVQKTLRTVPERKYHTGTTTGMSSYWYEISYPYHKKQNARNDKVKIGR